MQLVFSWLLPKLLYAWNDGDVCTSVHEESPAASSIVEEKARGLVADLVDSLAVYGRRDYAFPEADGRLTLLVMAKLHGERHFLACAPNVRW